MEQASLAWGKLSGQLSAWVLETFPFLPRYIHLMYQVASVYLHSHRGQPRHAPASTLATPQGQVRMLIAEVRGWLGRWLWGRALAQSAQGPGFHPPHSQQNKTKQMNKPTNKQIKNKEKIRKRTEVRGQQGAVPFLNLGSSLAAGVTGGSGARAGCHTVCTGPSAGEGSGRGGRAQAPLLESGNSAETSSSRKGPSIQGDGSQGVKGQRLGFRQGTLP